MVLTGMQHHMRLQVISSQRERRNPKKEKAKKKERNGQQKNKKHHMLKFRIFPNGGTVIDNNLLWGVKRRIRPSKG